MKAINMGLKFENLSETLNENFEEIDQRLKKLEEKLENLNQRHIYLEHKWEQTTRFLLNMADVDKDELLKLLQSKILEK